MVYIGSAAWCACHGDDIEAYGIVDAARLYEVVGCLTQVLNLSVVDGSGWVGKHIVTARLHLDEHKGVAVDGNNVKVACRNASRAPQ